MIYTIFQYSVKPDRVGTVKEAIDNHTEAIKSEFGDAVHLKIFSSMDNLSYVHFASLKDNETVERYVNSALLEKFSTVLYENCETYSQLKKLKFVKATQD